MTDRQFGITHAGITLSLGLGYIFSSSFSQICWHCERSGNSGI